jgi:hypothetical protein
VGLLFFIALLTWITYCSIFRINNSEIINHLNALWDTAIAKSVLIHVDTENKADQTVPQVKFKPAKLVCWQHTLFAP